MIFLLFSALHRHFEVKPSRKVVNVRCRSGTPPAALRSYIPYPCPTPSL